MLKTTHEIQLIPDKSIIGIDNRSNTAKDVTKIIRNSENDT